MCEAFPGYRPIDGYRDVIRSGEGLNHNMAHGFTDEQVEELREAFKIFDKDGDGTISVDEIKSIMSSRNEKLTDEEIKKLMSKVDIDGCAPAPLDRPRPLLRRACCPIYARGIVSALDPGFLFSPRGFKYLNLVEILHFFLPSGFLVRVGARWLVGRPLPLRARRSFDALFVPSSSSLFFPAFFLFCV